MGCRVRFGVFEADLDSGELRKQGLKIKLNDQPFQVLRRLLDSRGEVVSREDLQHALWSSDVYVDFDRSLNKAVAKLREALSDSAESPRFVETLPRQGYRFIAPIEVVGKRADQNPVVIESPTVQRGETTGGRKIRVKSGWRMVAIGALAVIVAATSWWWIQHKSAPIPIAVLPLNNLSEDPANDYFVDGLTAEIIRNLSIIDGLAVRSQTSSSVFKGKPRNVREAGEQLQADYILEGSVLKAGQQLRINAQLIRVRDDLPVWSGKFDRELTDVFAIQDEIARGIVNNLRLKLGRGRRRYETNVEAYDLYLRARSLPRAPQRIGLFEQVIAKDPGFAPAYAGLAAAYAFRSVQFPPDHPADELVRMRAAAEKAIQLDPLLAEAQDALSMVYARDGQWETAEKSFHRAIGLDPNSSSAYTNYAYWLLTVLGRVDEALQQLHLAEKADPLSPVVRGDLAMVLLSAGRYGDAAGYCLKLAPDDALRNVCLARARLGQGKIAEAIQILSMDPNLARNPQARGLLGYAYALSGRREEAENLAAASGYANEQALIFAGLGDKDRTLEALDRMAALGAQRVGLYLNYPELALLRGDPRLRAFRKKVGLAE